MAPSGVPGFIRRLLSLGEEQRSAGWTGFSPALARAETIGGGVVVSAASVRGVPAYGQAVRIASEAVARLQLGVWTGRGVDREKVTGDWRAELFDSAPNDQQTRFGFWEAVEESLTCRGNAFIWKTLDDLGRVREWWALHPDQVHPESRGGRVQYRVHLTDWWVNPLGGGGTRSVVVPAVQVIHFRGHGGGGGLLAPSPVEQYARALGAALSKATHEERLFTRSATLPYAITFPEGVSPETVRRFGEIYEARYTGAAQSGGVPVVGGGAQYTQIGLSQKDAQFIEAMNFSVDEIARITNVSASLIGGGAGIGQRGGPISPEHEEDRWHRYGLGPRLDRIESTLLADRDLFTPGDDMYPRFEAHEAVRGDIATEEMLAHQQIQDGRLLVDEWRAKHGYPPLAGGVGSIPQIVPVGGGPNPDQTVTQ